MEASGMIGLLISGSSGKMGRMIAQEAEGQGFKVLAGVDISGTSEHGFPVYASYGSVREKVQILIDFSSPGALPSMLEYAAGLRLPCVLGATGYNEEDFFLIRNASKTTAIFQSANMSLGVYVLKTLAAQASKLLDGFDIEIIEKHHNQKSDSPSGTALSLLDALKRHETQVVYGREGKVSKRQPNEIGVHAIRGGTLAGEHDVGFYGNNETVHLVHSAQSRAVFASGALRAARWLLDQPVGLYSMDDFMKARLN